MWKEVIVTCFWYLLHMEHESLQVSCQLSQLVKCHGRPVVTFVTYDKELVMYHQPATCYACCLLIMMIVCISLCMILSAGLYMRLMLYAAYCK